MVGLPVVPISVQCSSDGVSLWKPAKHGCVDCDNRPVVHTSWASRRSSLHPLLTGHLPSYVRMFTAMLPGSGGAHNENTKIMCHKVLPEC